MSSGRVSFVLTKHGTFDVTFGSTNPGVLRPVCSIRIFIPDSGVNSIVDSLRKHHNVVVNVADRGNCRGLATGIPLGRVSACYASLDSVANKHTSFVVSFTDCRLIPSSMRSGLVGSFRDTRRGRSWLVLCLAFGPTLQLTLCRRNEYKKQIFLCFRSFLELGPGVVLM